MYNTESRPMMIIRRSVAGFAVVCGLASLSTGIVSVWATSNQVEWANTSGLLLAASVLASMVFVFWQIARDI